MNHKPATKRRARGHWADLLAVTLFLIVCAYLMVHEDNWTDRALILTLQLAFGLLVVAVTRRLAFACVLVAGLFAALQAASAVKTELMGVPLLAPDLHYFATPDTVRVLARYPALCCAALFFLVAWVALLYLVWRQTIFSIAGFYRWIRAVGATIAAIVLTFLLAPGAPTQTHYRQDFQRFMFPHPALSTFFMSFGAMHAHKPAYDAVDANRFNWGAAGDAILRSDHPDIISVLEESTFDPRLLAMCDLPECSASLFDANASTVANGLLEVHTYGGATWTSEFSFFTGLPHPIFGDAGLYAAYDLAMRVHHTLPFALKASGYRTVAVYPVPRGFINAGVAYAHYGFDKFYDGDDLGLTWASSDAAVFAAVQRIFQQERSLDSKPIFLMTATMRQHAPHNTPVAQLAKPFDQPLFHTADEYLNVALSNYLERLGESARAIESLHAFVLAQPRAALLVQFGDHQPSFEGHEYPLVRHAPVGLKAADYLLTYYSVQSNGPARNATHAPLDIAFLGGLLLDLAGVDDDAYFRANRQLRELCNGDFSNCSTAGALQSYYAYVFGTLADIDD